MRLTRRRFLTVSAAFACAGGTFPEPARWQGRAMGTDASVTLAGASPHAARDAFKAVQRILAACEARWSLHRDSELTRLNRDGRLAHPSPATFALLTLAGEVHTATDRAFDPTVQPLWRALAEGRDPGPARRLIGWGDVHLAPEEIRLARPGMALTLNGIAQGAAADLVAAELRRRGFANVLADIGEQVAMGERPGGGPWRAAIAMPDGTLTERAELSDCALATSAPSGTTVGGHPHILGPGGEPPKWRLASVAAPTAALADALSTAACLLDRPAIDDALAAFPGARLAALA